MRGMRSTLVMAISVAIIATLLWSLLPARDSGANGQLQPTVVPITAEEFRETLDSTAENEQIAVLANRLAAEIEARQALQAEVEALSAHVSALALAQQGTPSNAEEEVLQLTSSEESTDGTWFNEQVLIDAGIEASEANRIKNVYEELALERLYLRDQAIREGWDQAQRREAFFELEKRRQALQDELGDETYDAYLYASGQPNRVQVQAVLAGSAADSAGIRAGDYILSYAEQRVYNGRDLRGATAQGTVEEMVSVSVLREGSEQQLYLPRGPLGIRMNSASVAPQN